MALISVTISAVLAIIFGIAVLVWPRALNLVVALYLIITGALQLVGQYF